MKSIKYFAVIGSVVLLSSFTAAHRPLSLPENPFAKAAKNVVAHKVAVKATAYKVDTQHSKLTWLAKKVTGEHTGTIQVSSGTLDVANNVLKGGSFELDTKTITVTDITDKESNDKLLGHLRSDDFFAVDKFDKAKFVITSAKSKGAGVYDVKGNLTIKGITNEVSFPATVKIDNDKLVANAKITVDRTKYGIKFRSKSFFENLGDKTIYDDFDLNIQLAANK